VRTARGGAARRPEAARPDRDPDPLTARASRTKLATQWMQMKLRGLDYVERDVTEIPRGALLAIDVLYSISSGLAFADPALAASCSPS